MLVGATPSFAGGDKPRPYHIPKLWQESVMQATFIFYAGVIALGFATLENVLYYGGTYIQSGFSGMLRNVFDRGLLARFSHALFMQWEV